MIVIVKTRIASEIQIALIVECGDQSIGYERIYATTKPIDFFLWSTPRLYDKPLHA